MKYLLDTHTWIWWHMNPAKLSAAVLRLISSPKSYDELLLSAISPFEFSKLLEKNLLGISCNPEDWLKQAMDMPKFRLVPISPILSYRATSLPQPFHEDPVDQLIVATARKENATILTKDPGILEYRHVKSLW